MKKNGQEPDAGGCLRMIYNIRIHRVWIASAATTTTWSFHFAAPAASFLPSFPSPHFASLLLLRLFWPSGSGETQFLQPKSSHV